MISDTLKTITRQIKDAETIQDALQVIKRNHFTNFEGMTMQGDEVQFLFNYSENFNRYKGHSCTLVVNFEAAKDKKNIAKEYKNAEKHIKSDFFPQNFFIFSGCYYYFIFKNPSGDELQTMPKHKK